MANHHHQSWLSLIYFLTIIYHNIIAHCSGTLVIVPSSSFTQGTEIHVFETAGSYKLLPSEENCPSDVFAIGGAANRSIVLLRIINFEEDDTPRCPTCISGGINGAVTDTISIKLYKCYVVMDGLVGIPLDISVRPEFLSTVLMFPRTFYNTSVVEGMRNSPLNVITPGIAAQTHDTTLLAIPSYRLTGTFSNLFRVLPQEGGCFSHPIIEVTESLDRETRDYYEVTLEAFVAYSSSSGAEINISTLIGVTVLDSNDHQPQPTTNLSRINVPENTLIGTSVVQFHASDMDLGLNAEVRYSTLNTNTSFTIHPLTGMVYSFQPLTNNNNSQSEQSLLQIVARDLGDPPLFALSDLMISIDSIDTIPPPRITIHGLGQSATQQQQQQVTVSELASVGEIVITIDVTSESPTADLELSLVNIGARECFNLSSDPIQIPSGVRYGMVVACSLDFESRPEGRYQVLLTALDNNNMPRLTSSSLHLLVETIDENEPPSFQRDAYDIILKEGVPIGTNIARISAADPENGSSPNGALTYTFTGQQQQSLLAVDAESGLLYTTAEVDYESLPLTSFQVTVQAEDGGGLRSSTLVNISVQDENDNAPVFTPASTAQTVTIAEDHDPDRHLFQFVAHDLDSGCSGAVEYSIVHADPPMFSLDPTAGLLYPLTGTSLDYESFQEALVIVRAADLGETSFSAETSLRVVLTDVNDERPVISSVALCPCFIRENTPNVPCPPLTAHDPDFNLNSPLTFEILNNGGDQLPFQIDANTGVVTNTESLDREERSQYEVEVVVRDGTLVSLPVILTVIVVDDNDNVPLYDPQSITHVIPSDLEPGDFVLDLAAVDQDVGYNSLASYAFSSGTETGVTNTFRLDGSTGSLYTRTALSDTTSMYFFTVIVTDLDNARSSLTVTLQVSGLRNHPPFFQLSTDRRTISEDLSVGSLVAQVAATDTDSGTNAVLTYSIVSTTSIFSMQPDGRLMLAQSVSRLAGTEFALNISAQDGGLLTAFQELLVSVYPGTFAPTANSAPLVFNPDTPVCHFTGIVTEMEQSSVIIATLPPLQNSILARYSIINESESAFEITEGRLEKMAGFASLFSQREAVFATLVAEYGSNFHFCSVTVAIDDINNNAPVFPSNHYSFEVYNTTLMESVVFRVQADDADTGSNAVTSYSISSSGQVPFVINERTGAIGLSGALTLSEYEFTVIAVDSQLPALPANATVTAVVLDTFNDMPVFSAVTVQTLSETARGEVVTLMISDADGNQNSQAINNFCIASGNRLNSFNILQSGGEITVGNTLDFESPFGMPTFELTIFAYDNSPNPVFGTTTVTIALRDENEPPAFSVPVYSATVSEGEMDNMPVINVTATDRDTGSNGMLSYSIIADDPVPFSVDPTTGEITKMGVLNREERDTISFNVTATDMGSPSMTAMAEVHITISDVNDIAPAFVAGTGRSFVLPEDVTVGHVITEFTTTDRDTGRNALHHFEIAGGSRVFSLDPWSGVLSVARELDFETDPVSQYMLTVEVSDLGTPSLSSSMSITIDVTNVNDNYPIFSSEVYDCEIRENTAIFLSSCQVSASDADESGNQVSYSLVGGGGGGSLFTVGREDGVITPQFIPSLDRAEAPSYVLQIRATDSDSSDPRSSTAIVRVSVIDSNDPPSIIPQQILSVYEEVPTNTLLFFAQSHDMDTDPAFSTVIYNNAEQSSMFHVDSATGAVFLSSTLDHETSTSMELEIFANSDTTSSLLRYMVNVLDSNENYFPPVFDPDFNPAVVLLSRSSPLDSHVVTLNASDPEGQEICYDITGGSGVGYFGINSRSGEIRTTSLLTSVSEISLTLEVRAADISSSGNGGVFPLLAWHELRVVLSSEISSKPFFIQPVFHATPSETEQSLIAAVSATIGGVVAVSGDSSSSSLIRYNIITSDDETALFSVNQSGVVSLLSPDVLDREGRPLSNITVRASLPGINSSSLALVLIEVEDSNDFRPTFPDERFDFNIFENFPTNTPITRIFAVDGDAGVNARLSYSLEGLPNNSPFIISNETGHLSLTRSLNRTEAASHSFRVQATNSDGLNGDVAVSIMVDPPAQPTTSAPIPNIIPLVSLREDMTVGTRIATVTLTNGNSISNSIIYQIIPETTTVVSILPNSGEIYLVEPLDFEEASNLGTLMVQILDGVEGRTPVVTTLDIQVTDVNDNFPVFNEIAPLFLSEANLAMGSVLGRVEATDADGSPASLTYSLVDSLDPSSMDLFTVRNDGTILLSSTEIDREAIPTHTLTVAVSDNGSPVPLLNFTRVTINIMDVNDHPPSFQPPNSEAFVAENTPVGEVIYTVTAFDPDKGTNAEISYEFLTPAATPFSINASSGEIRLSESIDTEAQQVHVLEIRASNPNGLTSNTNLNLTISVLDVLDSPPVLTLSESDPPSIPENYPAYSRVAQIQSPTSSRQVYYSIVDGNALGHFLVEPLTGTVRTTLPLDREEVATYQLVIQGAFGAGFETNISVSVAVADANDESPQFTPPFQILTIPENSPSELSLASVRVVDRDDGQNRMISSYVITDNFVASIFSIDTSGNLILNRGQMLDREGALSSLTFTVYVIDSGTPIQQYSIGEIQVVITDVNEPPQFERQVYMLELSVPVVLNVTQFSIQAVDTDIGINGELIYSLSSSSIGEVEAFHVDPSTGDISVANSYSLLEGRQISLELTATDGGGLNASTDLTITVKSCSFVNLTFTPSSQMIAVSLLENISTNSEAIASEELQIVDLNNAAPNVIYSLPLHSPSFGINSETGQVFVTGSLDHELEQRHELVIQATDVSNPSRIAQARALITILDVNDNPPRFDTTAYSGSVTDMDAEEFELVVRATDPDEEGQNSRVTYSLVSDPSNSFTVHPDFGIISLLSGTTLDATRLSTTITLVVTATDGGNPPLSSNASIFINIIDSRAPMFLPDLYERSISEDSATNVQLLNVTLADPSMRGQVSFRFTNVSVGIPFSISNSGTISLVDPGLDFEVQSSYNLILRAQDTTNGLEGFARFIATVLDSNDNAPVFTSSGFYNERIMEDATMGTTVIQVRADDADLDPTNARVTYRLNDTLDGLFAMDASSGNITLNGVLDYDLGERSYELLVLAQDSGSPSLTDTAVVIIEVVNVNDNPPRFQQDVYTVSVQENAQPGPTGQFVAVDDLDNSLNDFTYGIVEGPGSDDFSISPNGGINLVTANPNETLYSLNVSVSDSRFTGYATIIVGVEGVNLHIPVFNQSTYSAAIPEHSQAGVSVLHVMATDLDRGSNGRISYSVISNMFRVEPTSGEIFTTEGALNIDRETTPMVRFTVFASDGSLTGNADVLVMVEDINDNPPMFNLAEYRGMLPNLAPGNTPVVTVRAFDPDIGENSRLTYRILAGDIFIIDSSSGVITNSVPPDAELVQSYDFFVTVQDNGDPVMNATNAARIIIEIVEGIVPSFEESSYSVSVFENMTGPLSPIFSGFALNETTTSICGATLSPIRLIDPSNLFFLQQGETIITSTTVTNKLSVRVYSVTLRATCTDLDTGIEHTITATVNIDVLEVNEPPSFAQTVYNGIIPENSQALVQIINQDMQTTIMAGDPDEGVNSEVIYSLVDNFGGLFNVGTGTSNIFTARGLDFEERDLYILTLVARDGGVPSLSASTTVRVQVTDVNDNPPFFNQSVFNVSVFENATIGTLIHTAQVMDLDANSMHNFTISGTAFSIGRTTGEVRLLEELDHEANASYSSEISVTDGVSMATAQLVVTVLDSNDNPPVFDQPLYLVEVTENHPPGVVFTQVFASDDDEGENAVVVYESLLDSANFEVNSSTGEISFLRAPDREESPQFSLNIRATDIFNELSTSTTVVVRLLDKNDNSPVFARDSYTAAISENLLAGSNVIIDQADRIEATDPDAGENGTISFHIEGEGARLFAINSAGDIVSRMAFDREMNASFGIVVVAADMGNMSRSSNTTILIEILDQNDNSPVFPMARYSINVSESQTIGSEIFRVAAQDADIGSNGAIRDYSINNGDFYVEGVPDSSGTLTAVVCIGRMLDHENIRRYDLVLTAFDGLLSGTTELTVLVSDVDDNPPNIGGPYSTTVPENATLNTRLVTVSAMDRDASQSLFYFIRNAGNSPEIAINHLTGEIFVSGSLDYERRSIYNLIAAVSNEINIVGDVSTAVTIRVTNVNDVAPAFAQHPMTLDVQENDGNAVGTTLVPLRASDVDSEDARITYDIVAGNEDNCFSINTMGDVVITKVLDREHQPLHTLTVTAADNDSPSLTGSTTIIIRVTDINDNNPTGGHQDVYIYLLNGQAPLISLGEVFVNDSDIVNNHMYRLQGSEGTDNIMINSDGSIQVGSRSPQVGNFDFVVTVTDNDNTPVDTTITALIRDVTSETLSASFVLQFENITPQEFVDNQFGSFLASSSSLLDRELESRVDIQAISIRDSVFPSSTRRTDMTLAVQNITSGDYFTPILIQHILHTHRMELETELQLTISTVSVDVCSVERCSSMEEAMTCANTYQESLSTSALGSQSITYLGITSIHAHTCFSSVLPCEEISCLEPSYCVTEAVRGERSEADCIDDCSTNPCKNGGKCFAQRPGYFCQCPDGYDGRNCEMTVASFSGSSYAVIPALMSRSSGSVSFEVNMESSSGDSLLLYSSRFDDEASDFMMVEFVDGSYRLSISYGGGDPPHMLSLPSQLSPGDQIWQTLTIEYNSTGVSFGLLTFTPYHVAQESAAFGGTFRSLDLGGPVILGNVPEDFNYNNDQGAAALPGFVGCLRNLNINGRTLDFGDTLVESGVMGGCGCSPDPCTPGQGVCTERGKCECEPEFTGATCNEVSNVLSFFGDNFINYQIQRTSVTKRQAVEQQYTSAENIISLSLTTRDTATTLVQLGDPQLNNSGYAVLEIVDGSIQFRYDTGSGPTVLSLRNLKVSDAVSHKILVTRRGTSVELLADDSFVNRTTASPGSSVLLTVTSSHVYLGGRVDTETNTLMKGYTGCLRGVRLDGKELPLTRGGNEDFDVVEFSSREGGTPECPVDSLMEIPHSNVYVFAGLGAILVVLIVISGIFVLICALGSSYRRSRSGELSLHGGAGRGSSRAGSPEHNVLTWHDVNDIKTTSLSNFNLNNKNGSTRKKLMMERSVTETTFVDHGIVPAATAAANNHHVRQESQQLSPFHSRQSSRQSALSPPPEGFSAVDQTNPGFLQESPDNNASRPAGGGGGEEGETSTGKNRFVRHLMTQQSVRSTGTNKSSSSTTYIPSELLKLDDDEVSKYIRKKVELADVDLDNQDTDVMRHYKEEGNYQPLGSIGSLYDFLKDLESEEEASSSQHTPTHTKNEPPPSTAAELPPSNFQRAVDSSASASSNPLRSSGKRPKLIINASSPVKSITHTNTGPVVSPPPKVPISTGLVVSPPPTGPVVAPPPKVPINTGLVVSPPPKVPINTGPVISPPPLQVKHTPVESSNGHWIPINSQTKSQDDIEPNISTRSSLHPNSVAQSRIRRSGRRANRIESKDRNKDMSIMEKFHSVTAGAGNSQSRAEEVL